MSYDVAMKMDSGGPEPVHIEPYFDDLRPGTGRDGGGMTAVLTSSGYARCGNYTSNVSGIWTRCLTAVATPDEMRWAADDARARLKDNPDSDYYQRAARDTDRLSLRDLAGKMGEELAPLMARAVEWGVEHLAELHEHDPENGWGDADGAVTYLWDIQRMCEQHPKARLYVSS